MSSSTHRPGSNPSNENTDEQALYSSTVHDLIVVFNVGAIGFLQVTDQIFASTNAEYRRAAIVSFCVFILMYAVLRVLEVLKLKRNQALMGHFVGHISHLFGALALLMLVSLISPIFTLTVAPLWLVWLFVVMYICLPKLKHPGDADADPSDQLSQA